MRVLYFSILFFLTGCISENTIDKPTQTIEKQEDEKIVELEKFEDFSKKFYSDSVFQMSRIDFPIKGKNEDGNNWTPKNWQLLKNSISEIDTNEFEAYFVKNDSVVIEKWWMKDSGFYGEQHFRLINGKWFLVLSEEENN